MRSVPLSWPSETPSVNAGAMRRTGRSSSWMRAASASCTACDLRPHAEVALAVAEGADDRPHRVVDLRRRPRPGSARCRPAARRARGSRTRIDLTSGSPSSDLDSYYSRAHAATARQGSELERRADPMLGIRRLPSRVQPGDGSSLQLGLAPERAMELVEVVGVVPDHQVHDVLDGRSARRSDVGPRATTRRPTAPGGAPAIPRGAGGTRAQPRPRRSGCTAGPRPSARDRPEPGAARRAAASVWKRSMKNSSVSRRWQTISFGAQFFSSGRRQSTPSGRSATAMSSSWPVRPRRSSLSARGILATSSFVSIVTFLSVE